LACFTDSDKVEISNDWITCYDKNDIHIVGHFDIKINKDKNYEKYIEYKKNSDQEKFQIKAYAKMLKLQYLKFIIFKLFLYRNKIMFKSKR
jgi:hypothetical protein